MLKLFNDKVLRPMQAPAKPAAAPAASVSKRPAGSDAIKAATSTTATTNVTSTTSAAPVKEAAPSSAPQRRLPIIIVPGSLTACITLINVKDFLLEGTYYSVEEKRKAGVTKNRESDGLILTRHLPNNGGRLLYHIIDDPLKLAAEEWDLVVAVFATGQAWQFKGWKYSSPVTLFQNVLGVHVCVDSAVVDANIQSWNCKVLKVSFPPVFLILPTQFIHHNVVTIALFCRSTYLSST